MKNTNICKQIIECAKKFEMKLRNKNILFVYIKNDEIKYFETIFLANNFAHLTGVKHKCRSSYEFYDKSISGKLSIRDFDVPVDGVVEQKLSVLLQLLDIPKAAKMLGDFNDSKMLLYTEKIIGNIYGCMGFVLEGKYSIPNTILKIDIRDLVNQPVSRVLAVFVKDKNCQYYDKPSYVAKGVDVEELLKNSVFDQLFDRVA